METDASTSGWGCIIRYLVDDTWAQQQTSVVWASNEPTVQVQCEAEALHQALLTFIHIVQGNAVLHVTDCAPTLDLPDRGSAASAQLQQTALAIWFLCSKNGIFLSSAWVPGDDMIRSGCDALSCSSLEDPHCAFLRPTGWASVELLATKVHRELSIDWFADNLNHQLPSYWSRFPLPDSLGCDALSAPSWDHFSCSHCGATRTLFGYFFPPVPLLDRVISKAKIDGASGILVVPRLVSAIWWPVLCSAALSSPVRLPADAVNLERQHCSSSYRQYIWNAIAFDFSRQPRSVSDQPQPCQCPLRKAEGPAPSSRAQDFRDLHSRLAATLLHS